VVVLTDKQLLALMRFQRGHNVYDVVLTQHLEEQIVVAAKLKAGKGFIERRFVLDAEGKLVTNRENTTPEPSHSAR
jgi:hypothetical protein